ncbi:hypothetical protein GA0070606_5376 [Micromonospora citrea]|uniref:Uncharacterized protein n=1 Tax=Micromonospora citrea TaxID=47855 RepID=A0A1C6VWU2_9ACTN|nr:hypothetical protein [Micromonospora citrea]SCL70360.1 hypothetical protein GA0070606_5376 [Micromonospora citrea]
MGRRSEGDGEAWIAVEVRAPRWAVWCVAVCSVVMGMAGVALVALRW